MWPSATVSLSLLYQLLSQEHAICWMLTDLCLANVAELNYFYLFTVIDYSGYIYIYILDDSTEVHEYSVIW